MIWAAIAAAGRRAAGMPRDSRSPAGWNWNPGSQPLLPPTASVACDITPLSEEFHCVFTTRNGASGTKLSLRRPGHAAEREVFMKSFVIAAALTVALPAVPAKA